MEKWEKDLELRNALMDSFNDTVAMSESDERLSESVRKSIENQELYCRAYDCLSGRGGSREGRVIISRNRTFDAAAAYKGKKIAVLNFASAVAPGGSGHKATLTQEECLCRESTLYSCISDERCMDGFYGRHSYNDRMYNADMIYTPDVTVFKSGDSVPVLRPREEWFDVDVITMAAPDISMMRNKPSDDELLKVFEERFTHIMGRAAEHGVDVLILGAFGCGMFGNDPFLVAVASARVLEKMRNCFDTVEFAVYEGRRKKCYRVFSLVMDRYRMVGQDNEPDMEE